MLALQSVEYFLFVQRGEFFFSLPFSSSQTCRVSVVSRFYPSIPPWVWENCVRKSPRTRRQSSEDIILQIRKLYARFSRWKTRVEWVTRLIIVRHWAVWPKTRPTTWCSGWTTRSGRFLWEPSSSSTWSKRRRASNVSVERGPQLSLLCFINQPDECLHTRRQISSLSHPLTTSRNSVFSPSAKTFLVHDRMWWI